MTRQQHPQTKTLEQATPWTIDPAHSSVSFSVKHLMFATVRGRFKTLKAAIHLDEDDPNRSYVEAEIDAASIDTDVEDRDTHLRSGDFFAAEAHPKLTFRSTRVEPYGDGKARLVGQLTIRGTTKEVTLDVTREGVGTDPWGNTRAAYSATTRIDRSEFGLTWNQVLEAGGVMVGDKIQIQIEVQAVKQVQGENPEA